MVLSDRAMTSYYGLSSTHVSIRSGLAAIFSAKFLFAAIVHVRWITVLYPSVHCNSRYSSVTIACVTGHLWEIAFLLQPEVGLWLSVISGTVGPFYRKQGFLFIQQNYWVNSWNVVLQEYRQQRGGRGQLNSNFSNRGAVTQTRRHRDDTYDVNANNANISNDYSSGSSCYMTGISNITTTTCSSNVHSSVTPDHHSVEQRRQRRHHDDRYYDDTRRTERNDDR